MDALARLKVHLQRMQDGTEMTTWDMAAVDNAISELRDLRERGASMSAQLDDVAEKKMKAANAKLETVK